MRRRGFNKFKSQGIRDNIKEQENYKNNYNNYNNYDHHDHDNDHDHDNNHDHDHDNNHNHDHDHDHDHNNNGNNKPNNNVDFGGQPLVIDIDEATKANKAFRRVVWTGEYMQMTLMSIDDEIGVEMHKETDQFLRIEEGRGIVVLGKTKDKMNNIVPIEKDIAILIPAGTWHNIINKGKKPLKLYSLYAPPKHKKGKVEWEK